MTEGMPPPILLLSPGRRRRATVQAAPAGARSERRDTILELRSIRGSRSTSIATSPEAPVPDPGDRPHLVPANVVRLRFDPR